LPGLNILAVLLLAGAVALLVSAFAGASRYRRPSRRLVLAIPILLIVTALSTQSLIPALVQRFVVNPDPFTAERTYLARSITATRAAFGLGDIEMHDEGAAADGTVRMQPTTLSALQQVQLWDTSVAAGQMRQLATTVPYLRPADSGWRAVGCG
jgi:uncharacterized protein